MQDWYNTIGGRHFADATVPALVEAIEQLVKSNEQLINKITELTAHVEVLEDKLYSQESDKKKTGKER